MRLVLVVMASFFLLTSCMGINKSETMSNWKYLKAAKGVECRDLSMNSEFLRINRVHLFESLGPSLFVETTSRRGQREIFHLVFGEVSKISEKSFSKLHFSSSSIFIGAGFFRGQAYYSVISELANENYIEIYDLIDGRKIFEKKIEGGKKWTLVDWVYSNEELRVLLREEVEDESIDDQPYIKLAIKSQNEVSPEISIRRDNRIVGDARIISYSDNKNGILWYDRGTSEAIEISPKFKFLAWDDESINNPLYWEANDVENWGVLRKKSESILAAVRGDTLLWRDPRISVSSLEYIEKQWFALKKTSDHKLEEVHVKRPLLARTPIGDFLFIQQWLDHESTIAAYKIKGGMLDGLGSFGVFNSKETVENVFYHEVSNQTILLVEDRRHYAPIYRLCELDM